MNAVWRLVRTFWPKKKCHHIRTFSKVLKLMALFESSYATACPLVTVPKNRLFVKPTFRFFFMSQAPAGGRRTVVGGARVVSGAEKKII